MTTLRNESKSPKNNFTSRNTGNVHRRRTIFSGEAETLKTVKPEVILQTKYFHAFDKENSISVTVFELFKF